MVVTTRETLVQRDVRVAGAIRIDGKRMGTNPGTAIASANPSLQRLMSPGFRGVDYSARMCALPPDLCDRDELGAKRAGRSGSRLSVLVGKAARPQALAWRQWCHRPAPKRNAGASRSCIPNMG